MKKPLQKITHPDILVTRIQDATEAALAPVLSDPFIDGIILPDVVLHTVSSPNIVNHKLGRKLQGWVIVRKSGSGDVWDTQVNNQSPEKTLYLHTNAETSVTVTLRVF